MRDGFRFETKHKNIVFGSVRDSPNPWGVYCLSLLKKLRLSREEPESSRRKESCSSSLVWCNSSTILSIYEVSWWVIKWKGHGGCVFIRSKPIGQVSTFHTTTLWRQLVPFLVNTIHSPWPLTHSNTNSPSYWQCHAEGILQNGFTARFHLQLHTWHKQCVM